MEAKARWSCWCIRRRECIIASWLAAHPWNVLAYGSKTWFVADLSSLLRIWRPLDSLKKGSEPQRPHCPAGGDLRESHRPGHPVRTLTVGCFPTRSKREREKVCTKRYIYRFPPVQLNRSRYLLIFERPDISDGSRTLGSVQTILLEAK